MNNSQKTSVIDLILDQIPQLQNEKRKELRTLLQSAMEEDKKSTKEQQYEKVKNLLGEYTNGLTNKFLEFLEKRLNDEEFASCAKDFQIEFKNNNTITKEDQLLMRAVVSANHIRFEDAKRNEQLFAENVRKKRTIVDLVRISKHIKI